jgi:hypothetical protein
MWLIICINYGYLKHWFTPWSMYGKNALIAKVKGMFLKRAVNICINQQQKIIMIHLTLHLIRTLYKNIVNIFVFNYNTNDVRSIKRSQMEDKSVVTFITNNNSCTDSTWLINSPNALNNNKENHTLTDKYSLLGEVLYRQIKFKKNTTSQRCPRRYDEWGGIHFQLFT